MKRNSLLLLVVVVSLALSIGVFAQDQPSQGKGKIVAPPSSLQKGLHTPLYIFIPEGTAKGDIPNGETPASIACVYGVTAPTSGCPKNGTVLATGGAKAIAVVDYGHNSTLQSDFNTFNTHFGLPAQTLTFICDCNSCPVNDGTGWDVETALDTQYAHAMAPNAQIIVSQFCSDPFSDTPTPAEQLAGNAVAAAGGGEVSNSFGYGGEFNGELNNDQYMQVPTVVYFTSAGDAGLGPDYPSVSPYTVSVGGTRIIRDNNGNFTGEEDCWSGSGGGISAMEPLPLYQNIIHNLAGTKRATPDLAADADPFSGVLVYSTTGCGGWCQVGGTSVASPVLAGITNAAGNFLNSTNNELTKTYGEYRIAGYYNTLFYDVRKGNNGAPAKFGWDECTGIGTPRNPYKGLSPQ
jgi:kumamolisin